jgi:small subunit ribosomal protein S16
LAVKIRLARHGAKKAPFYRVVVADGRARRDGRFLEILGRYNPRTEPATVELDVEKADAWIAKGAQPTEAAAKLIAIAKGEKELPKVESKISKKAAGKKAAEAEAATKAAEAPVAAEEPAAEVEEAPAEEPVAEEPAAEAEEAPAEEPAAEEPAAEEAPAEEPAAEAEEAPAEDDASGEE